MDRRVKACILAAAVLLTGMTGCGTRSILVPVTRSADIHLHAADTALILPSLAADGSAFSHIIADRIDSLLPVLLPWGQQVVIAADWIPGAPSLFTPDGQVSRRSLRWWTSRYTGGTLLACDVTSSRFNEEVTVAPIQSTRTPGSVKQVRQGRAEAVCRIVLVDMRRELLLFDDSLIVADSRETHASDETPPPLDVAEIAEALARRIAERIADASHPVRDRDVVTFLVDDDYPEIDAAIGYAEEGRWKMAAGVLRRLAAESAGQENEDIVWYDLGLVLQYDENFKEALAAFDRAIAIRDRSRYRHARATLLGIEEEFLERLRREH
jgi:hypothetical protein